MKKSNMDDNSITTKTKKVIPHKRHGQIKNSISSEDLHNAETSEPENKDIESRKRPRTERHASAEIEDEDEKDATASKLLLNGNNEAYGMLGGDKRRVTIRKFKGNVYVDIREFYEDQGEFKPGKKGISLSADQFLKLKELMPSIEKEVAKQRAS